MEHIPLLLALILFLTTPFVPCAPLDPVQVSLAPISPPLSTCSEESPLLPSSSDACSPNPGGTFSLPLPILQDVDTCRICFEGETINHPFLTPCACRGSQQFIHRVCLLRNLIAQGSTCRVCRQRFQLPTEMLNSLQSSRLNFIYRSVHPICLAWQMAFPRQFSWEAFAVTDAILAFLQPMIVMTLVTSFHLTKQTGVELETAMIVSLACAIFGNFLAVRVHKETIFALDVGRTATESENANQALGQVTLADSIRSSLVLMFTSVIPLLLHSSLVNWQVVVPSIFVSSVVIGFSSFVVLQLTKNHALSCRVHFLLAPWIIHMIVCFLVSQYAMEENGLKGLISGASMYLPGAYLI